MKKTGILKKVFLILLSVILGVLPCASEIGTLNVSAKTTEGTGSYADNEAEVVGTWSANGNTYTNRSLLEKLPDVGSKYRFTTENYDEKNGAFDTSNWATSFMWDLDGDNPYSSTVYAIPLAFRASVDGGAKNIMQVTAPSSLSDTANNTYTMQMPANGTVTDFLIQTPFDTSSAKVDAVTDWSYDVVMEKTGEPATYMKTTMVQGSIFAYFELVNADTLTITRGKGLPAGMTYKSPEGNVMIIRCFDNMDEDYDYYAFYGAAGTSFSIETKEGAENQIASIKVSFSSGKYLTLAYLGSAKGTDVLSFDAWAEKVCQAYRPYAYNFVTDTRAEYHFDESSSKLRTVYSYAFDKKPESTADGTIIGVLPHQYKNILPGTDFLDYTYQTVRGVMKTIAGSDFTTELTYSGILPFMPDYTEDEDERAALKGYLDEYVKDFGNNYFGNYEGTGDTYWDGKGMNRLANAMAAADTAGDTSMAESMFNALKSRLEEWFTYSGSSDSTYFYYDDGVGALFGFPQSYDSVNQINDHHFHYGYFIYAAAQVAFRDKEWASRYGKIVEELIYDIACPVRNSSSSKYPYLRNFAPYEGHSWASGHANFDMGNNQESSSEALNAWAGIILWGEATGNKELRDLGIYLYATEVSAVQNYWYDTDQDVLSDAYRYKVPIAAAGSIDKDKTAVVNNSAAMVWGGSYTYATWFSGNPLHIQGINLLPMNPTCFYLAGNKEYIRQNYDLAYKKAAAEKWNNKEWVDIWCQYYAMAFPEEALAKWKAVEEGEGSYGVEGGDTKAHTYHFIKALCTFGTPDTTITSDTALSSVFVKDGVKTYCAYNAGATSKTVNFSDGYQLTVEPGSMGVEEEGSGPGAKKYSIEYYVENMSGAYELYKTDNKYGKIGEEVELTSPRDFTGYVFDSKNDRNILKAELKEEGSTVLKAYYNRAVYQISYQLGSDVVNEGNPSEYKYGEEITLKEPVWEGRHFIGWYTDEACTMAFTGIGASTTGDFTLWAKWLVIGDDEAFYKVEYYKETEEGSGIYTLAESETLAGKIGDEVSAQAREYEGYIENTDHAERKVSGEILEDGSLVLKLYYMVGEPEIPEGFGFTYDASSGTATFYFAGASGGLVYIAVYDDKETAEEITKKANASPPGFDQVPGHGGYPLNPGTGRAEYELTVAEGKYLVYAFNPDNLGVQSWYAGQAVEKQPPVSNINYTVKYYQQNTTLDGYVETAVVNASGKAGDSVRAEIRSYPGFTQNSEAEGSLLVGELAEGEALELRVYYDRNKYPVIYHNLEGAVNPESNAPQYIYGAGLVFQNPVKQGFLFEGWYEDEACQEKPITTIDKNRMEAVNVYAKWREQTAEAAYIVKYYLESLITGRYEEVIADRFEGSGFVGDTVHAVEKEYPGFERNEDAEESVLSGVLSSEETIVLQMYFDRKEYEIIYHNMDGAQNPEANKASYLYGAGFKLQKPTKNNCIFDGWYLDEQCSEGNEITEITNLQTGELHIFAKWIQEQAQYTVRYYLQNKTLDGYAEIVQAAMVKTADAGARVDAREEGLVREFTGFALNAKHDESCLSGAADKQKPLTLKLYYDRETYPIVYENMENARNHPGNEESYVYGVGLRLQAPEKDDQIFAGWYMDEACTEENKVASIGLSESGPVTVYAKWIEQDSAAPYTVHYYLQSTNLREYQEATADLFEGRGEIGTEAMAPLKEYEGFAVNENAKGFVRGGTVTEDGSLELKIYYDRCSYEIIYHNVEDAVNPAANKSSYTYGIGFTLRNPVKEGYIFDGWYENEGMKEEDKTNQIGNSRTGIVHLYAKWKKYTDMQEDSQEEDYDFTVETIEDQYYTGSKIVPTIVVKDGERVLAEKKDYTVKISNNVNVGSATVRITGKGNYTGVVDKTFQILPVDIGSEEITADDIYTAYKKGRSIKVNPKLKWGKKTLKSGKDYEITGSASYSQVGVYHVTLKGKGNYTGERTLRFEITDQILMSSVKIGKIEKQYYRGGQEIMPELFVTYKGEPLTENTDYTVEYENNMQAGTATVIVTGIGGKYVGVKKTTFKIEGIDLKKMQFALYCQEYEYTGRAILPQYFSGSLKAGKDFTVTYSNNTKAGTGTVIFAGMGAYSGTVKKTFKIVPYNIANNTAGFFEDTGGEIVVDYVKGGSKPTLQLKFRDKVLTEGTDYTLKYKNNNTVGEAAVTVTGKGNFKGSFTKDFTIAETNLNTMLIIAEDVVYKTGQKASYYMPKITVMDKNGKKLTAGKDYERQLVYTYMTEQGEKEFNSSSQIGNLPADTVLKVTLKGMGNYTGKASVEYKVVPASIKSAKVTINSKAYTGTPVTLNKEDIQIRVGGVLLQEEQFEIVEGSYLNNDKKGTAKVTIHGIGEYGGYKTVNFKIGQRSVKDIIAGIFGRD